MNCESLKTPRLYCCWDESKVFNGFDDVLKYIVEVQKTELEGFVEAIGQFAKSVDIAWDDDKLLNTILEKIEIRKHGVAL